MKRRQKLLTDEQWELIEPLFPKPKPRVDGKGRPPAPNRPCFQGILWILQIGAARRFLPDEFPRLLVRHDYLLSSYYAFFYLGCFSITLRGYS
jgi:transposase